MTSRSGVESKLGRLIVDSSMDGRKGSIVGDVEHGLDMPDPGEFKQRQPWLRGILYTKLVNNTDNNNINSI